MRVVRRHTAFVSGIPRDGAFGGGPSPKTAWGVFVAIEAGVQQQFKRASLEGVSVAVQGLGSVGMYLAQHLRHAGAKLVALHARGITYLPDYLVNAGGIVSVAREYRGEGDEAAVMAEVSRIRERVIELLEARAARGPAAGARRRRLGARQAAVAEVRS